MDNSISGNPEFLAKIAENLSSDDCFGGTEETCDATVYPEVTEFPVTF